MKPNQPSFGGKLDNGYRALFATGAESALNESAKSQSFLMRLGFHDLMIVPAQGSRLWGISPMRDHQNLDGQGAGEDNGQLERGR